MRKTASQIADEVLEKCAVSPEMALQALTRMAKKAPTLQGIGARMYNSPRSVWKALSKMPGNVPASQAGRSTGFREDQLMDLLGDAWKAAR